MAKALIAYYSRTGKTKKMAEYIAEGVRMTGSSADVKPLSDLKKADQLTGYDGYALGSPTYHRDMTEGMKQFLFLMEKAEPKGKVGCAFGSYTHSGDAPKIIFDTLEHVFKMEMLQLGSFNLKEAVIDTDEGLRACQDYGKALGEKIGS
jgi:flavodoxin